MQLVCTTAALIMRGMANETLSRRRTKGIPGIPRSLTDGVDERVGQVRQHLHRLQHDGEQVGGALPTLQLRRGQLQVQQLQGAGRVSGAQRGQQAQRSTQLARRARPLSAAVALP